MADTKITGLTEDTAPASTNLLVTVDDPGGTPVNKKVTVANMGIAMVGPTIHGSSAKTTPVDADTMPLIDSAASNALKKVTWANVKATLNAVYAALAGSVSQAFSAASLELGHASDTTLTRASAGVLAVGGVNVLTVAGGTLTGSITLGENTGIALDPAGSADGKWSGMTVTGLAGYSQAFGDLVYLDPTDSRWEAADANAAAGADGDSRGLLGLVVVAGTDGNACTILLTGIIRADAKFPSFTVNNPIYVSETAGSVTQTQPTTTDVVIRVVGAALTADEMFFRPDFAYITHT